MDAQIQIFDEAVRSEFGALVAAGFLAAPAEEASSPNHRPYSRTFAFRSPRAEVTCSLVLAFGSDDEIVSTIQSLDGARTERRARADKGQAVRKAVAEQARQAVAELATE
jgi:hypothetical protein